MAVKDLRKRRVWLGVSANTRFWTADLLQTAKRTNGNAHSRRRRVGRQHFLHYVFRVFSKTGQH